MIMDAIVGNFFLALGGFNVFGILVAIPFVFVVGFVFFKITN